MRKYVLEISLYAPVPDPRIVVDSHRGNAGRHCNALLWCCWCCHHPRCHRHRIDPAYWQLRDCSTGQRSSIVKWIFETWWGLDCLFLFLINLDSRSRALSVRTRLRTNCAFRNPVNNCKTWRQLQVQWETVCQRARERARVRHRVRVTSENNSLKRHSGDWVRAKVENALFHSSS